jgi:hypothetical protein
MLTIAELEIMETVPTQAEYPNTSWGRNATLGEKYNGAFAAENQEQADFWLLMLVGHRLRFDSHSLTWKQAFIIEREELAWRALAKDIGDFELYAKTDEGLIERAVHREFVARMYKAALPIGITGRKESDILERVHIRRERAAKVRGESYWRKGHQPEQVAEPAQGSLF